MSETNPYVEKKDDRLRITDVGLKYLEEVVTDPVGPVYAFTSKAPTGLVAAAMARLSRRGSDLREIYLDEFAVEEEKAQGLLDRVITGFGDDSVQQLDGIHMVVEGASNLLTKALEWGRLAAYLEQSTRYIYFDQLDENGNFLYYRPLHLPQPLLKGYVETMDKIFGLYSEMVHKLTEYVRAKHPQGNEERAPWLGATRAQACDAIRPVLPVATKSTVGIYASAQSIDYLIMRLLGEDLPEFREVGQGILNQVRQIKPVYFKRTDLPERGGAITAYRAGIREGMRRLAKDLRLDFSTPVFPEEVVLINYWPQDELDLVPEMMFETAGAPIGNLREAVGKLPQLEVESIFNAYFGERLNRRHKPGRAVELAHYEWEITADYGTFRDIQRHRVVDAFEWQRLAPTMRYEIPPLVEEAGVVEAFKQCFEHSEILYWWLEEEGFRGEAQYATLLGNKMRYRFATNLREAFHLIELRSGPQGHPGYRRIANRMYEEIAKVHPLAAANMRFVNRDEDPELTRMAAERATHFKLQQMEKTS